MSPCSITEELVLCISPNINIRFHAAQIKMTDTVSAVDQTPTLHKTGRAKVVTLHAQLKTTT